MSEPGLFPAESPVAPRIDARSPGRRLTERQAAAVRAGFHPLLLMVFGPLDMARLHPEASRDASRSDPRGLPFTCGSCRFRRVVGWHRHGYPKCAVDVLRADGDPDRPVNLDSSPRASHGGATDVRGWWPACRDYEPGEPGLSDDAARVIPAGNHEQAVDPETGSRRSPEVT